MASEIMVLERAPMDLDAVVEEQEMAMEGALAAPQGWTKKVIPRKRGTPNRKDVVFIAPNGEQIKTKRQLERYLRSCPGGFSMLDFDWSIGVSIRRSGRSNSKKRLSIESIEIALIQNPTENQTDSQQKVGRECTNEMLDKQAPQALHSQKTGCIGNALTEISNLHISKGAANGTNFTSKEPATNQKRHWNPPDPSYVVSVKTALHLSAVPDTILCRNDELEKVIKFCKTCISEQKSGSLYVCGCPGTGKSLTMERVKTLSLQWANEAGILPPELVYINCTTLTDPRHIYQRILQTLQPDLVDDSRSISVQHLKRLLSSKKEPDTFNKKMQLLIIDEMDYLITRDQSVLYDLFQLSVSQGSSCILIGIANAIDLTERFLPRLRSLNCNPDVVTFPAYTKDQILAVLKQRLMVLPITAFHPMALELCARKVSAASGDMRKVLYACRTALELFETEMKAGYLPEGQPMCSQQDAMVQIDHMARALAKIFRSPVIETIQSLPKHSQMVLCSAVRLFRNGRKHAPLGELNKRYLEFCKATAMHPVAPQDFSGICQLLADQGLLSLGTAREDRLKKVKLQVDHDDVVFALQGVRFFRNNLM